MILFAGLNSGPDLAAVAVEPQPMNPFFDLSKKAFFF